MTICLDRAPPHASPGRQPLKTEESQTRVRALVAGMLSSLQVLEQLQGRPGKSKPKPLESFKACTILAGATCPCVRAPAPLDLEGWRNTARRMDSLPQELRDAKKCGGYDAMRAALAAEPFPFRFDHVRSCVLHPQPHPPPYPPPHPPLLLQCRRDSSPGAAPPPPLSPRRTRIRIAWTPQMQRSHPQRRTPPPPPHRSRSRRRARGSAQSPRARGNPSVSPRRSALARAGPGVKRGRRL